MFKVIILLSGLAAIFFAIAGTFYFQSQNLLTQGSTAPGTVVRLEASAKGASYPIIRFQAESGEIVEDRGKVGSSPPEFKVGDTVPVVYDKSNPKTWTINSWLNLYFLPTLFFSFGTAIAIASLIMLIYNARRKRSSGPIQ